MPKQHHPGSFCQYISNRTHISMFGNGLFTIYYKIMQNVQV